MPGGRNKSIGPVQVSMSSCFSVVSSFFAVLAMARALYMVDFDHDSSLEQDGAKVHLTEPFSALPVPSAGIAGL